MNKEQLKEIVKQAYQEQGLLDNSTMSIAANTLNRDTSWIIRTQKQEWYFQAIIDLKKSTLCITDISTRPSEGQGHARALLSAWQQVMSTYHLRISFIMKNENPSFWKHMNYSYIDNTVTDPVLQEVHKNYSGAVYKYANQA